MQTTFFLLGLSVVLILFLGVRYNRLVVLRNKFKNAFSQIDVQLKRRYDLIPNLLEATKGYLQHERETLQSVVEARAQASQMASQVGDASGADAVARLAGAESALSGALGRLFAVMEAYPDLKGNQTVASLMEELSTTENKVSFARQAYNDSVMVYMTALESFPDAIYAGILGFQRAQLFEISVPLQREVPKISF